MHLPARSSLSGVESLELLSSWWEELLALLMSILGVLGVLSELPGVAGVVTSTMPGIRAAGSPCIQIRKAGFVSSSHSHCWGVVEWLADRLMVGGQDQQHAQDSCRTPRCFRRANLGASQTVFSRKSRGATRTHVNPAIWRRDLSRRLFTHTGSSRAARYHGSSNSRLREETRGGHREGLTFSTSSDRSSKDAIGAGPSFLWWTLGNPDAIFFDSSALDEAANIYPLF